MYKPAKEGTNVIPIKLPEANHSYGKPLEYFFLYSVWKTPSDWLLPITMERMTKFAVILFMPIRVKSILPPPEKSVAIL